MDGIRVSYILSTKDRCAHLERTLANVREFITPADELIVVDGASRDATAKVVEAHRDIVTHFLSEPDRGEAHGFNKAVLLARGRLIKAVTDDDYIYPAAMHQAIAALEADGALDAIVAGGEQVEEFDGGGHRTRHFFHLPPGETLGPRWILHVGCGLGLLMRRRVVARVGLFDPRYLLADVDYLARMLESGCAMRYCDIKLFRHTVAGHSLSRRALERDRDWIRVALRSGHWPGALNAFSFDALCRAFGVDPGSHPAGLVRALRDLGWMTQRVPWLARAWIAWIGATRALLQGVARAVRPASASGSTQPVEPPWDGRLR